MPRRHFAINLLERGRATLGHAVEVARGRVFSIRFIPPTGLLEKVAQSIVRFGEAWLAGDQCSIVLDRRRWIGFFARFRGQKLSSERDPFGARGRRGQERSVGLRKPASFRRWQESETGSALTRSAYDVDLFEPATEIGQNRGVFEPAV